jgi:hypothetical protein
MIPRLASPSICVIDDEKEDYEPILAALSRLGFAHTHVLGKSKSKLKPLRGIRLVFTDLHLAGLIGKAAASHTANVFKLLFPPETPPLVVVIWSKYADDPVGGQATPPRDQPTEADLFKTTLLEAVPSFKESLFFCEMKKPKVPRRPKGGKWVTKLKGDIQRELQKVPAFDVLWSWECLVRDAAIALTNELARFAQQSASASPHDPAVTISLHDKLKNALRILARESGGPDCTPASAPRHLVTILAQTLADHIEHSDTLKSLASHGEWLSETGSLPDKMAAGLNGLLLTASPSVKQQPFTPGTVYRLKKADKFRDLFGVGGDELSDLCYSGPPTKFAEWKAAIKPKPILLEISPGCDVQQGTRRNALLVAGLILPAEALKKTKRADSIEILPMFSLRWSGDDFEKQDAFLVFFSRFKITMKPDREPPWLKPWFRLRELPTAALRNWHSGHAARVGYASLG